MTPCLYLVEDESLADGAPVGVAGWREEVEGEDEGEAEEDGAVVPSFNSAFMDWIDKPYVQKVSQDPGTWTKLTARRMSLTDWVAVAKSKRTVWKGLNREDILLALVSKFKKTRPEWAEVSV